MHGLYVIRFETMYELLSDFRWADRQTDTQTGSQDCIGEVKIEMVWD